ncbi:hypothetical protein [Myxosarcina sp. GI1]|uniref:hypothetical protein n=1 Tax=Myxosarcina sp. GI1 TaxID=1541065 RepID=UPI000567AC7C|nr:hypothetical protein [Myxosarcina sp. GI1]
MHQRPTTPTTEVELFPFLSVLFCTIGTLILIVVLLVAQAAGSKKNITIVSKSNLLEQTKQPRYIEAQGDGIIIHPTKTFVATKDIATNNSALSKLFAEIKSRNQEYLIVAIRPDGVKVFAELRELIEAEGIELGYEPIDSDWQLKIK